MCIFHNSLSKYDSLQQVVMVSKCYAITCALTVKHCLYIAGMSVQPVPIMGATDTGEVFQYVSDTIQH